VSRRLKYDLQGPDWRLAPEELAARGPAACFSRASGAGGRSAPPRLVVDLGFGRGEFLLGLAEKDAEGCYLGVEVSFKRVLKLARRLARAGTANVRLVQATAQQVVGECLPEGAVDCFWINFPDPWPKKRHRRRRLLQPDFVRALVRCLAPGGLLHVATDHVDYAELIDQVLAAEPGLANENAPERFRREVGDRAATAYELEWRAEGRPLHFFTYRRVAPPGSGTR
jgi:tRNA (guanine-N7-)-methyltransferase